LHLIGPLSDKEVSSTEKFAAISIMPFIDDDLLWCPDNDGKMVDLSCLVIASVTFLRANLALRHVSNAT
jgi:hypothetical protein